MPNFDERRTTNGVPDRSYGDLFRRDSTRPYIEMRNRGMCSTPFHQKMLGNQTKNTSIVENPINTPARLVTLRVTTLTLGQYSVSIARYTGVIVQKYRPDPEVRK